MQFDVLRCLGLTHNEILIYTSLLARGISTTGPILQELSLSSSRLYASLENLAKKGLVSYFMKNNVRYYQAYDPKVLIKYAEEIKKQTEQAVVELSHVQKKEESQDHLLLFEGFRGFQQAFQLLLTCTPKDEICTIGFMLPTYRLKALRLFLQEIDAERNRKKIRMKIILDEAMRINIGRDREKEKYTTVKYMPKGYFHPAAISIFKDCIIQWTWREKPIVFVIKNTEVSQSFKTYFQLLWNIAEK